MIDDERQARDLALISRLRNRDSRALAELYDRYAPWVYGLAGQILPRAEDAQDVVVQLFMRVWDRAADYHPDRASVAGWISVLARRLAIDVSRSASVRAAGRETDDPLDRPATNGAAPDPAMTIDLQRALSRLDDGYRELVHLSYIEGFSHAEISNKLKMPLGTVKTRLRTAVSQLRETLATDERL